MGLPALAFSVSESFGRCEVEWVAPEGMLSATECSYLDPDTDQLVPVPVRVLAYTLGEENFDDANGNGYFDLGEFDPDKDDKGEAFLDLNDNDQLDLNDPVESKTFFVDWNNSGAWEGNTGLKSDRSSTLYNGTACVTNVGAADCSNELIYVWDVADPTQ